MTKSNYLLQYRTIKHLSVNELIEEINRCDGLPLKTLHLSDLLFYQGKAIHTGSGVYVFKNREGIFYIGKCSKRSFIERIPSHLDTRSGAWFNSLLKLMAKEKKIKDPRDEDYQDMAREVIDQFSVVLINFEWGEYEGDLSIDRLEDLLRMTTSAKNRFRSKRLENRDMMISEFIQDVLNKSSISTSNPSHNRTKVR